MEPKNRKVIYTAVVDAYDDLKPPAVVETDIDYIAYTDNSEVVFPAPWVTRVVWTKRRNPRVTARWHKLLPHYHLYEYDYSFWIDANFEIVHAFSALFDDLAATTLLATRKHPQRNCIYDEAEVVKAAQLDHPEIVDIQMAYYRSCGFPPDAGLIESGILFRAHRDRQLWPVMHAWWEQIELFSQRDQLSANFVFWKYQLPYTILPWIERSSKYVVYHPHKRMETYTETEEPTTASEWLRHVVIAPARPGDAGNSTGSG